MKSLRAGITAATACAVLAACHIPGLGGGPAKAPTGQVVAVVGDREITQRDLNAEMGNAAFPDPKTRKIAEQLALRNIIGRIVLANAAHEQGLDKTPDFALQKRRALDEVLAQTLQQKIIKQVPEPSTDEVQTFMTSHPDIFLERKVFTVDQIRMGRPSDPAVIKALEPLTKLEQVEDTLKTNKIPYERSGGTLDAVGTDPTMLEKIVKLPKDEIFVIPSGQGLLVEQIRDTKVVPFTGDPAKAYAERVMMRQRVQEAVSRTFGQIMGRARAKIRFNKDYAPAKPGPAPAPATPPAASPAPAQ